MGMDWGGIIAGALGGGASAVDQIAQGQIDTNNKMALEDHLAQVQADKTMQIERARAAMALEQHQAAANRINTAKGGIVQGILDRKFGDTDAAIAAAQAGKTDAPLTPEQQAVIDQNLPKAKASDRARLDADTDLYSQAAAQTGDLDPKTIATMNAANARAQGIADARMYGADSRERSSAYTADSRADSASGHDASREKIAADKVASLSSADKSIHNQLVTIDKDIGEESKNVRAMASQMATAGKADAARIQAQIDAKTAKIEGWRAQKATLMKTATPAVKSAYDASAPPTRVGVGATGQGSGGAAGVAASIAAFNKLIGQ